MRFDLLLLGTLLGLGGGPAFAAEPAPADEIPPATDPSYRLALGDRISVSVFGEPELSTLQVIDQAGTVRLPLIGAVRVAGRTVREAEDHIEKSYRSGEMLKAPQATLALSSYAPREVTLLGAVRSPGTFQFPTDTQSLDIRDVIARQGGFTAAAKGDTVAVTRTSPDGQETITVVNVERMMFGRARNRDTGEVFLIYPGDRIFVPERLF
jgi:polysaccharide biosynthesis/export protein